MLDKQQLGMQKKLGKAWEDKKRDFGKAPDDFGKVRADKNGDFGKAWEDGKLILGKHAATKKMILQK